MTDYISREALINKLRSDPLFDLVERYGATDVINSIPAANVRPVVLCKDCTYCRKGKASLECEKHTYALMYDELIKRLREAEEPSGNSGELED